MSIDTVHGRSALASVTLPDRSAELRTFSLSSCGDDDGWLRVEASGICGTDVSLAAKGVDAPLILGHHVVGQVEAVGEHAATRWKLGAGDWVAVEEYLPCWSCARCRAGLYRLCPDTDLWRGGQRVGLVPVDESPALWGGNAQYLYLPPNAVVHRLPAEVPRDLAVWTLPLANAIDWVRRVGGAVAGENVVLLGPGHHGLAAVAAAKEAMAGRVVVGGTARDGSRLRLAEKLGAATFDASAPDAVERVCDLTAGGMADLVVDTVGAGPETLELATRLLAPTGRLVVAGIKDPPFASLDTAALVRGMHTVSGVRGRDPQSVHAAIHLLARGGGDLGEVPMCEVPLQDVGDTLAQLADGAGPDTPHVVVRPWLGQGSASLQRSNR